jgi:hypothetical protein
VVGNYRSGPESSPNSAFSFSPPHIFLSPY